LRGVAGGVYARFDGLQIWLTTENGLRVANTVPLDPHALLNFEAWLQSLREGQGGRSQATSELILLPI
jgi:hypothetical protein